MTPVAQFDSVLASPAPILALAPMQDITDLPFWNLIASYGGPDLYFTEYFRVYATSHLNKGILESITANSTGQPVIAQIIGNDLPAMVRAARELQQYPVAGIDLNLGCPAPVVFRKSAGGGLLRHPKQIDALLGALREAVHVKFSVKTRIGVDSLDGYDELLAIFARHSLDLVTVHGRTVQGMYRSPVDYEAIARAVAALPCPVIANGNIYSPVKCGEVLKTTGSRGVMIGRGVIRNPWLFRQIREDWRGEEIFIPNGRQVLNYIGALYELTSPQGLRERSEVQRMKKYLNYIGVGIDSEGRFLHEIRRARTKTEFFKICADFLDHDRPMALAPFILALKERDVVAGEWG